MKRKPVFARIAGVEVVTIPLADYKALLEAKGTPRARPSRKLNGMRKLSPIDADPALQAFIVERLSRMPMKDIAAECRRAFGSSGPSASSIHRFATRLSARSREAEPPPV